MACNPATLKQIPLFALLDDDELGVLAAQVEFKQFAARQRIYKMGEPGHHAYVMMSGQVRVTTVDEDHQEVLVDDPGDGEFCQSGRHSRAIAKRHHIVIVVVQTGSFAVATPEFVRKGRSRRTGHNVILSARPPALPEFAPTNGCPCESS